MEGGVLNPLAKAKTYRTKRVESMCEDMSTLVEIWALGTNGFRDGP